MFRELPTKSDGRWALSPESALIFISFSGPPAHLPLTSCSEPRTKFYNVSFAQCGHCCQISVGFEYGKSVSYLVKWSFSSFAFDYSWYNGAWAGYTQMNGSVYKSWAGYTQMNGSVYKAHTCQHLEIRNQNIFTILADWAPKACPPLPPLPRKIFEFSLSRIAENAPNLLTLTKSVHRFQQIDCTLQRCLSW